jgi:hypothetical protein
VRFDSAAEASTWRAAIADRANRRCDVYFIPHDTGKLPGTLAAQTHAAGGVAYRCRGTQCEAPVRDPGGLTLD